MPCLSTLFKFKLTNGLNLLLLLDEACIPLNVWIFANVTTWGSDVWIHFNELVLFPKKKEGKKTFTVLLNICIRSKRWSSSVYLSVSFLLIGFWTPFFPQQVLTAWTLGLTVGPGHWWRQRDSSLCAQTCLPNRNSERDSMLTQKRERPRIQNISNNHVYNM